jgi:hypothetical protein
MEVEGIEFGFINSVVLYELRIEPGYGIEPLALECVIKGLSEVEVLQDYGSGPVWRS